MIIVVSIVIVLFLAVICYSIYKSEAIDFMKILSLPLLIAFAGLLGYHYLESLGRPVISTPEGEWNYIYHLTDGIEIELWVQDEKGSKLYVFPYNDQVRKKLEEAGKATEQGQKVIGEFGNDTELTDQQLTIKEDKRIIPKNV